MKTPPSNLPRVLIVDDNADGLLVRRALLEEAGWRVEVAENGAEGLSLFQRSAFDVVVTDYRMPGMNGAEVIQAIRLIQPQARIILLSGFVDPLGLTEENTGADVVLPKSSQEAVHLVRWVRRLMNRPTPRKFAGTEKNAAAKARATTAC